MIVFGVDKEGVGSVVGPVGTGDMASDGNGLILAVDVDVCIGVCD